MSGNQNRRSGRSGGHQRGGYSGGGAKGGASSTQLPQGGGSSSNQPSLSSNRSFNKKGNNAQGSFRQNPSSAFSDANSGFAPATPPKGATPNGSQSHFQPPPQVAAPEKPTNMPPPRNPSLPRGPPQSAPKVSEPSMPPLPSKGDQSKGQLPVPLQFGTINMGMMNGLPIPARTSSAPPNLDEQKRNQAMLDAMKGASHAPHMPLPSGPRPQIPQPRKEPTGTSTNTGTGMAPVPLPPQPHPSLQPVPPQPKPTSIHLPAPPVPGSLPIQIQPPVQPQQPPQQIPLPYQHQIPVPFQHQQPPQLQFGGHNPQMNPSSLQMSMNLPVGSAPQQMFVQGFNPQQQAMLHQSQSMGFAPAPPGHQLGPPQLGSLGLGPQYPPQQQQSNKYGGVRKTTTVKITHPDTHEEVKLDNMTHRHNVMTGHSGPMPSFPHMAGYYPVQTGSYNPYFPNPGNLPLTSNQMPGGSQAPRFPYPVTQTGQPMNFMQQQAGKQPVPASSSHGHSEGGNVETVLATGTNRPAVTITNPPGKVSISKPSEKESKLVKSVSEIGTKAVTVGTEKQTGTAPKAAVQMPVVPVSEIGTKAVTVGTEKQTGTVPKASVQVPVVPAAIEEKKKETVEKIDSSNENEKKASKKEDKALEEEQPKLEVPVPVTEDMKQTETVSPVEEEKSNGTNEAPILNKPDSTILSKPVEEENPVETEEKSEKNQQEEKSPKIEAEPEKTLQEEEKPVKTEQEKKTDEVPDKVIEERSGVEKESEKPVLEVPKPVVETEEEKKRPNSSASSISTDSESLSSGTSSLMNGSSTKPESKNSKPKDINGNNNNKPVVEVPKRPASSKKKKKIKEILSKADAAGSSDLYNAYKGPEEKSEAVDSSTITRAADVSEIPSSADDVSEIPSPTEEESGANKGELEDWEDVADISTPKLPEIPAKKKYSRDFLLTFTQQCTDLPVGFQPDPGFDALLSGFGNNRGFDQPYPSPGRGNRGGERRLGNSSSFNDGDKWIKSPGSFSPAREPNYMNMNPPTPNLINIRPGQNNYGVVKYPRSGQPSNQFMGGGILSPMPAGGTHRTGSDMDRWQHTQRGLIPSPVASPHQMMHKAESKYVVGKVSDEEQAKQRQLKGILNKLTPQNFEKLFEQVKDVNIDNPSTLSGVISQIFDKALMEPTFCEMYANFCSRLATALPDFSENNEKITFKRLLLNKCQEEFERGEREEAEAGKSEEEGEVKQTPEEREEKRLKARRRMLGNIRLIGELYKKKMLTERIMHECIKKLLGPSQNPDEEDIEALCKLMSTIGEMIDQPRAKEHMDIYFDIIAKLSNNKRYTSRVKFMLKDTMDLRKNKWQQRRKVEGPKKIEDVHRDAANERQAQTTRLTRGGPIMNNPPPRRTGTGLVSPISQQQAGIIRGMTPNRMQDIRYEERSSDRYQFDNRNVNVSLPLPQRVNREETLTLGPQGGLGRGMSIRGQQQQQQQPIISLGPNGSNGSEWNNSFGSRLASPDERSGPPLGSAGGWSSARNLERNFSTGTSRTVPVPSPQAVPVAASAPTGLPDSVIKEKSISAIKEYVSAKDEKEVRLCIEEMNSPGSYHLIISSWINYSFERKNMERDMMFKLLINLCKPREGIFNQAQLLRGFEGILSTLEDVLPDAPKAAEYLGELFAQSITEGFTSLNEIGRIVLQAGEEPGMLVEAGIGGDLIGCTLESVKKEKGEGYLKEVRAGCELKLEEFRPPAPMRSKVLDLFL
ncbi:hypothetical protein LUZ60_014356 [Juncus effusus]|nr:hypothetical protein LUZ60_014356 [Juncus effusus]